MANMLHSRSPSMTDPHTVILGASTTLICLPILYAIWHLTCNKPKKNKEKSTAVSADLGLSDGQKKGWAGMGGGVGGWKWMLFKRAAKKRVMDGF